MTKQFSKGDKVTLTRLVQGVDTPDASGRCQIDWEGDTNGGTTYYVDSVESYLADGSWNVLTNEKVLPDTFSFHTKWGDLLCTANKMATGEYNVTWGRPDEHPSCQTQTEATLKERLAKGEYWLADPLKPVWECNIMDEACERCMTDEGVCLAEACGYVHVKDTETGYSNAEPLEEGFTATHDDALDAMSHAAGFVFVSDVDDGGEAGEICVPPTSGGVPLTINLSMNINNQPADEYIESMQGKVLTLKESIEDTEVGIGSDLEIIKEFTTKFPVSVFIDSGKYIVYYRDNEDMFAEDDFALGEIMGSVRTLEKASKNG